MVRNAPVSLTSTISPTSSMIPVNICSQHKIGSGMAYRPVSQRNRVAQSLDTLAADRRNLTAAEDSRGKENNYLINDSGTQRVESQIRSALQEKALDLHVSEL